MGRLRRDALARNDGAFKTDDRINPSITDAWFDTITSGGVPSYSSSKNLTLFDPKPTHQTIVRAHAASSLLGGLARVAHTTNTATSAPHMTIKRTGRRAHDTKDTFITRVNVVDELK